MRQLILVLFLASPAALAQGLPSPGVLAGGLCTIDSFGNVSCQDGGFADNLGVTGAANIGGILDAGGINTPGQLSVTGNALVGGILDAGGINTPGNLAVVGSENLGGTLDAGNIITGGSLSVTGASAFTGVTTHNGSVTFASGATASGSTAFDLSGSTGAFKTSTGAVTIGGATTISGTNGLTLGTSGSSSNASVRGYVEAGDGLQNTLRIAGSATGAQTTISTPGSGDANTHIGIAPTGAGSAVLPNVASGSLLACQASTDATHYGKGSIVFDSTNNVVKYCNGTTVNVLDSSTDWVVDTYDPVTLTGTTGNIYQVGPIINAGTLRDITHVAPIAGTGTGTETIKLATTSGCGSNVLGTLSVACNAAANTVTTGTVNSSALAASSTLFVCITAACTTADIQGNISAHFTTP